MSSNITNYSANLDCGTFNITAQAYSNDTWTLDQFNEYYYCGLSYGSYMYMGQNFTYNDLLHNSTHQGWEDKGDTYAVFDCGGGYTKNVSTILSGETGNVFPHVDAYGCGQTFFSSKATKTSTTTAKENAAIKMDNNKSLFVMGMIAVAAMFA